MKLYFRKTGSGPPLVILHGLYGSSDNWYSIARQVSSCFTVYLPDLRNHGQSPHSHEHTYDSMSNDLYELTEGAGLKKIFLAGHSMGGKAAMKFALKWPGKLNSLVIIDISPFGTDNKESVFYKQHSEILDSILSLDLSGLKTRTEADNLLAATIRSDKIRGFILKNLNRKEDNTFEWKLNAESLRENLTEIMAGITGNNLFLDSVTGFPVTFIKGELSDYLESEDIADIRKLFPSAEMTVVEQAGHWIHSERPEAIVEILMNQLNT